MFFPSQIFVMQLVITSAVELECMEGWIKINENCHWLFSDRLPWLSASQVCKSYGSRLLMSKDLLRDDVIRETAAMVENEALWLGDLSAHSDSKQPTSMSQGRAMYYFVQPPPARVPTVKKSAIEQQYLYLEPPVNSYPLQTSTAAYRQPLLQTPAANDETLYTMSLGRIRHALLAPTQATLGHSSQTTTIRPQHTPLQPPPMPNLSFQSEKVELQRTRPADDKDPDQCVLARIIGSHVIISYSPCDRKSAYICQRPSAPVGSFHCTNGRFVQQHMTCDGDDDCGDGSDERNCSAQCRYHLQSQNGTIMWPDPSHPQTDNIDCVWVLQANVGYNIRLQFSEFSIDSRTDEVTILVGGLTQAASRKIARLTGELNNNLLPSFTSINNLLVVTFTSASHSVNRGFRAVFIAMKAKGFEGIQHLMTSATPLNLYSPFYPNYLSSQDYTWIITAECNYETLTLEVLDIDLKGSDRVLFRDGNSAYHPILAELTSSSRILSYLMTTGRQLYFTMQTRGLETGRGFHFRYWQGCSVNLTEVSGEIHSPGFSSKGGNYGSNMTCVYYVTVPGRRTVTVKFNTLNIHPSDQLMIYDSNTFLASISGTALPSPFDISSGDYRIVFKSDAALTSTGFSISYSIACTKLPLNDETIVTPRTFLYRYGAVYTVTCTDGYAFPHDIFHRPGPISVGLECLEGGVWNVSTIPTCSMQCQAGWYLNNVTHSCKPCAVGQFQTQVNRTSCELCPQGTTTEALGSPAIQDCKKQCPAGQYFNRLADDCVTCPLGYFQHQKGQFKCLPCPVYKTTLRIGADSPYQCVDDEDDAIVEDDMEDENLIIVTYDDFKALANRWQHDKHGRNKRAADDSTGYGSGSGSGSGYSDFDFNFSGSESGSDSGSESGSESGSGSGSGCGSIEENDCNGTQSRGCKSSEVCVKKACGHECVCQEGFLKNHSGVCVKPIFCDDPRRAPCHSQTEVCINLTFGHQCMCKDGFQRNQNGVCVARAARRRRARHPADLVEVKSSKEALIGGTVGAVVAIVIILTAIVVFRKRRASGQCSRETLQDCST